MCAHLSVCVYIHVYTYCTYVLSFDSQSKDKMTRGSRRGCIKLKKALMGIDDEDECTFTLHSEGRTFHFQSMYMYIILCTCILCIYMYIVSITTI